MLRHIPTSLVAFCVSILVLSVAGPATADLLREDSTYLDQSDLGGFDLEYDSFGRAVAVGDFNCDGLGDTVFGIPGKDLGGIDIGQVIVAYGVEGGLPSGWQVVFEQGVDGLVDMGINDDRFGSAFAVGNFDGDGCDDLAISVYGQHVDFDSFTFINAGAIHVLYGSEMAGGLSAAGNQVFHRASPSMVLNPEDDAHFGRVLAAGDFNGDTYDDLAIAVPGDPVVGQLDVGSVHMMYGGPTGLNPLDVMFFPTNHVISHATLDGGAIAPGDKFGSSLAACDFNNDGRADLAIGVPFRDLGGAEDAGGFFVLFGTDEGLDQAGHQYWTRDAPGIPGTPQDDEQFGAALAAADFDGDGRCDLAVGAPHRVVDGVEAGQALIFFGNGSGISSNGMTAMSAGSLTGGAPAPIEFGAVLGVGDFDGDGRSGLVIGAPNDSADGLAEVGAAYVLDGRADRTFEFKLRLDQADDVPGDPDGHFATSFASGDVDGDGVDDLVVGNPSFDGYQGGAYVFYSHGVFFGGFESGDLSGWSGVAQ